jgi:hypothetical protein
MFAPDRLKRAFEVSRFYDAIYKKGGLKGYDLFFE